MYGAPYILIHVADKIHALFGVVCSAVGLPRIGQWFLTICLLRLKFNVNKLPHSKHNKIYIIVYYQTLRIPVVLRPCVRASVLRRIHILTERRILAC